jgi:hypothetical protein
VEGGFCGQLTGPGHVFSTLDGEAVYAAGADGFGGLVEEVGEIGQVGDRGRGVRGEGLSRRV